ncbi:hypothetical protein BLA29_012809 [Euroglyphus maynei]|uniref:Fatty acyl-CoA reductase C-terminal domain-containing protein n=1 Tax=Euroglyphus maynei TaxID=6958 RepID=A0A1Y3B7P8_EURMA|nr:hypothetical protein BLA29_012809 [Euroglyphus maynei]
MAFIQILDQVYQKVHRVTAALEFFTTNEWTYTGMNMLRLIEAAEDVYRNRNDENLYGNKQSMNVSGRFPVDMRQLNWSNYFHDYVLGVRRFLLKEDPATIPRAQNQLFLYVIIEFFISKKILIQSIPN